MLPIVFVVCDSGVKSVVRGIVMWMMRVLRRLCEVSGSVSQGRTRKDEDVVTSR
jgi:hypothetical protein